MGADDLLMARLILNNTRYYHFPRKPNKLILTGARHWFCVRICSGAVYGFDIQWRHNGCDSVSDHQRHDCLPNRLFRCRSKKISKLRVTGLCAGNSPLTGEFPAQRASNAEIAWWRHHDDICMTRYKVWGTWWLHLEFGWCAAGCHKTISARAITFDGHRLPTAKTTNVKMCQIFSLLTFFITHVKFTVGSFKFCIDLLVNGSAHNKSL